jgi:two-component system sensor histidine kinase QseC
VSTACVLAAGVLVALAVLRAELARRAEVVARAGHELRGPLCAAGLALHGAARDGGADGWADAVGLELERAGAALADLAAATAWPSPALGRLRRARRDARVATPGMAPTDDAVVLAPVDVAALVRAQSGPWVAAAPGIGRRLVVSAADGAVLVHGDRARLAQAVGNLLANAVEHGEGTIELSVGCAGGVARVEVTDEGRGLPGPLDRLVRGPRGGRGGRGRGLAIAAGVAARHGGRLVTGPSRRGARIALELPAADAAAVEAS